MLKLVKEIFLDISFMFKNFFHFEISKLIIFSIAILYMLVFAIPFLLLVFLYYYFLYYGDITILTNNTILNIIFFIIAILSLLFSLLGFFYSFIMLIRLDLKYIKGKKLGFKKNYYFNFKLFFNFVKLFLSNILVVFSPIIVGIILISILIFFYGGVEKATEIINSASFNLLNSLIIIITFISILFFIYFLYRTIFSFVILVDISKAKKFDKSFKYIKKSFKLTKGIKNFFKFLLLSIIISIISLPINFPIEYFKNNHKEISDYIYSKNYLNNDLKPKYLEYLNNKFGEKEISMLNNDKNKNLGFYILFEILYFIFILGIYEMMIVSFYKRELLTKKK